MNRLSIHSPVKRRLAPWLIAAAVALLLTVGQVTFSQWLGVDWTPTAAACQGLNSGGGC